MSQTTKAKTFKQFMAEKHEFSIQIKLPADLSERVLSWGDENVPDSTLFTNPDDPAFGREDEPHITVLYRMSEGDPRPVEQLLTDQKPLKVTLEKTSLFTLNDNFDVLKIGVQGDDLHQLNRRLGAGLSAARQYLHYLPHVTVAFVKKKAGDDLVGDDTFEGESFTVDELYIASKDGTKTKIKIGAK